VAIDDQFDGREWIASIVHGGPVEEALNNLNGKGINARAAVGQAFALVTAVFSAMPEEDRAELVWEFGSAVMDAIGATDDDASPDDGVICAHLH
jgi:hypothetical protein